MIKGLYPFSTSDGQSIPLDIISPSGLIRKSFNVNGASAQVLLPEEDAIIVLAANQDCIVSFGIDRTSLTDGEFCPDTLYIQAGVSVVVQAPDMLVWIRGVSTNGSIYIQKIDRWAGLGLKTQYTRK